MLQKRVILTIVVISRHHKNIFQDTRKVKLLATYSTGLPIQIHWFRGVWVVFRGLKEGRFLYGVSSYLKYKEGSRWRSEQFAVAHVALLFMM
jgi:hypothetical protein